ncbi:MAG TPA: hypothetical protein VGE07_15485 [Herpetosiphonaceae bacterium]
METSILIKQRAYHDSVTLMAASQRVAALPGVTQAVLAMGTDHNKELLGEAGLLLPEAAAAAPDDLIIALQAVDAAALNRAAEAAEAALAGGAGAVASSGGRPARSLRAALRQLPDANLALVAVPGAYAAREARQALQAGLHVLLFSDNVSLEDEIDLKRDAAERGLLCMGPDCGTAVFGGVGLGFANQLRRGAVGIVSASGTGAQEVSVLIDRFGGGVSQIIGTGGRDLQPAVGGATMLAGIDWLARDAATETILLISKPPDAAVAERVLAAATASGKRVIACFLGHRGEPPAGVELAPTLWTAARLAVGRSPELPTEPLERQASLSAPNVRPGRLRGLFSGGTLYAEARLELERLGLAGQCDLTDYGDDQFTRGRPHPMIDWTLRLAELRRIAAEPATAVILLDVVLGHAAHQDPAPLLAPALAEIRQPVVAYVCGTDADPQDRRRQAAELAAAGALLADSNLAAAHLAGLLLKEAKA